MRSDVNDAWWRLLAFRKYGSLHSLDQIVGNVHMEADPLVEWHVVDVTKLFCRLLMGLIRSDFRCRIRTILR